METARISVPTIFEAAVGTLTPRICDERLDSWSRELVRQAGIRIDACGRENIVPGESFVVMSNHQSHYDIPVLYQALGIPMRMVAKKEIFRIPLMARAMRAAGFIEVDRKNSQTAIRSLSSAHERLGGVSLWIAPEGTRSKTGHLGTFKKGGFHLALKAGLRILPVTIDGTRFALPAGGLHVTRGALARVTVGSPIAVTDFGSERIAELVGAVRQAIVKALPPDLRD